MAEDPDSEGELSDVQSEQDTVIVPPTKAVQGNNMQMPDRFADGWGYFQQHKGRFVWEPVHAPKETPSYFNPAQVDKSEPTIINKYRRFTADKPKHTESRSKVFCNKGAVPPPHWRKVSYCP